MSDLLCRKYGVAWCDVASSVVTMMLHCVAKYVVWVWSERIQSSQISLAAYLTGCAQLYMHITMATPFTCIDFRVITVSKPYCAMYYNYHLYAHIILSSELLCIDCGTKPRPHAVHVVVGVVLLC